ncbi:hypothetical protein N8D56_21205 [Devosia sp. A8/3-2]|nr:hypothetical protein N8D56_21205 [Devosia sp. A8/3-2]
MQVLDVDTAIFEDCSASDNFNDGFNYTPLNGKSPHFLEINCSGSINRATGTGNATTAHGDCRGYRFNPSGYRNYGIGLADIDTVKSFNVGVVMEGNGVPSSSANGFGIYTEGSVEMWLHGARASGNFANPQIVAEGNSIIRYRDCYPIPVAQETAIVAPF